jgi:PAS domain S-box-containing protein
MNMQFSASVGDSMLPGVPRILAESFSLFCDSLPHPAALMQHAGDDILQMRFAGVNSAFTERLGYESGQVAGMRPSALYQAESYTPAIAHFFRALTERRAAEVDTVIHARDGEAVPMELSAVPIVSPKKGTGLFYWQFIYRDISASQRFARHQREMLAAAEQQGRLLVQQLKREMLVRSISDLSTQETDVRRLVEQAASHIGETLQADVCVIQSFVATHGHSFPLTACYSAEHVSVDIRAMALERESAVWQQLTPANPVLAVEDIYREKLLRLGAPGAVAPRALVLAGGFFGGAVNCLMWIGQYGSPRAWQAYEVETVQLTMRSVALAVEHARMLDELVKARAESERRAAQLAESLERERQHSKLQNQFVATVSHEFRTPLAIIDGAAQLMERKLRHTGNEDDYALSQLHKTRRAVRRLTGLVDSTLELSNFELGRVRLLLAPVQLGAMLTEICSRQNEISKDRYFCIDVAELPARFMGDVRLLDQLFTHLVANACKYSPAAAPLHITGTVEDRMVTVRVRDGGMGIPQDEALHVFENFFRASNALGIPGTGIGLYLAKSFAELHGGRLCVENTSPQGTTFCVRLPLTHHEMEESL